MLYQEMGMDFILYTIRVNMPLLGKGGNLTNQGQCVSEQCNHENPISHPELKRNRHESEEKQAAGPGSLPSTILACLFQYKKQEISVAMQAKVRYQ